MAHFNSTMIAANALGGTFIGSGGGGNLAHLKSILESVLTKREITLLELHQLPDDCLVAAIGSMGSPELMEENPPDGTEGLKAIALLEKALHRKVDALYTLEGAGVNHLYPLIVSAKSGLPILNGDGMGRAFPELQMSTPHIYGRRGTPFVLISRWGFEQVFEQEDNYQLELKTRKALAEKSGTGYFAGFALTGRQAKECLIPGLYTLCREIGEALSIQNYDRVLPVLSKITQNSLYGKAVELFIGRVTEIEQIDTLNVRTFVFQGTKHYTHQKLSVHCQNENVIAYRNEQVAAMVPDLISFLSYPTCLPLNNNEIGKGMEIAILGIPSPNILRTRKALSIIGPQIFGYKMEYQSLEQLHSSLYYAR